MTDAAPFAVLVAEQLAVSGARLTISVTSAGRVATLRDPPYFLLIDRALRDEGTSVHYQPPAKWSHLAGSLRARLVGPLSSLPDPVVVGDSWTTDAPYRETAPALAAAGDEGVLCVEMEAAALYAYATARGRDVVCLAHLTNTMAVAGDDFEKGLDHGAHAALSVARAVALAALRTA